MNQTKEKRDGVDSSRLTPKEIKQFVQVQSDIHHMKQAMDEINETLKGFDDKFMTRREFDLEKQLWNKQLEKVKDEDEFPRSIFYDVLKYGILLVIGAILSLVIVKMK